MQLKYSIIVLTLLAVANVNILAQEEINKDVRVVREYTPTVSDAFKVSRLPAVKDSVASKPAFSYRILSTSVITEYEPSLISPAKIRTRQKQDLTKSYLKGGIGTYETLLGELGYNILESDEFLLGLKLGHTTSLGELKLEDGNAVDAPFHDTYANMGFKYFFDEKTLSVDLDFQHNVFKYYGLQSLDADAAYLVPSLPSPVSGAELMPDSKQRLSVFDLGLGFKNDDGGKSVASYEANFGFSTFGNLTGVRQNALKLTGSFAYPVNDLMFKLDARIEGYKASVPDSIGPMFTFDDRSITYFQANPSINFNLDKLRLKLGMVLGASADTEGDRFFVAPDILANFTVVEGIVSLYGGLDGRINLNDYRSVAYENPFVSPDANIKSSLYGVRVFGGVEGNFSSTASFAFGMDYSLFNDEHFYVNKYYNPAVVVPATEPFRQYSNMFVPVYDDGSLLKVKGEVLYRPQQGMEFMLYGAYYGWQLDTESAAWHKPETEMGIRGSLAVNDYLTLSGGIAYLGERQVYEEVTLPETAEDNQKALDGIVDVNAGAEYRFTSRWTFWGNVANMAGARYYQWNGYPTQRFNVRLGVIYAF